MSLDLDAIMARDGAVRYGGEAWSCLNCELCSGCQTLRPCEAHDDDTDVIVLVAEVKRLRAQLAECVVEHPGCWDGLA